MTSEDHLQLNRWGLVQALEGEDLDLPEFAVAFGCKEPVRFLVVGKGSVGLGRVRVVISDQLPVGQEIIHNKDALGMIDTQGS